MCGIFGAIGPALRDHTVSAALDAILHRGPDAHGFAHLPGATLGHTRLRIIDLSAAAAQPMANEDGTVVVTFNGEIYNFQSLRTQLLALGHSFRSGSDTEVLVHGYEQWGDELVSRLDGMFAFGVWDSRARRLLVARDRAGKKPLFYAFHGGRFYFASEIKALFAAGLPVKVHTPGLVGYLAYGYTPPPDAIYEHVHQLPPAHLMVLDAGTAFAAHPDAPILPAPQIRRYWSADFSPAPGPAPSQAEAESRVRQLLSDAVKKRLVADVPVGAFLSGGLDSTIVVGLMAQLGHKPRTFSIGFSGDPRYDETHFARIAAKAFKTDHTEFRVTPSDFELVDKLIWHHDGPFGDSSAIPTYVVSRLTREHVTVALTGDGGDELFAGYLRFWAAATTETIPAPLRKLGSHLGRFLPTGTGSRSLMARARRLLLASAQPLAERLAAWNAYFVSDLASLLQPELRALVPQALQFHRRYFDDGRGSSPLAKTLNHNFDTYLPFDLLVKTDRSSMACALEARSPFLDTALIEYAAGLPDNFKLRGRTTKFILREAFKDLVPPEILHRGKMGFGLPLGTWFRGDLRNYVHDHLTAPTACLRQYLSPKAVADVLASHTNGTGDREHHIWLLLTLELWLRQLPRFSALAAPP